MRAGAVIAGLVGGLMLLTVADVAAAQSSRPTVNLAEAQRAARRYIDAGVVKLAA